MPRCWALELQNHSSPIRSYPQVKDEDSKTKSTRCKNVLRLGSPPAVGLGVQGQGWPFPKCQLLIIIENCVSTSLDENANQIIQRLRSNVSCNGGKIQVTAFTALNLIKRRLKNVLMTEPVPRGLGRVWLFRVAGVSCSRPHREHQVPTEPPHSMAPLILTLCGLRAPWPHSLGNRPHLPGFIVLGKPFLKVSFPFKAAAKRNL